MCLDGEKNDRVAFQARADYQNHAIGWLHRGYSSLAVGKWYDFHEFGWYMGNVGFIKLAHRRSFWLGLLLVYLPAL